MGTSLSTNNPLAACITGFRGGLSSSTEPGSPSNFPSELSSAFMASSRCSAGSFRTLSISAAVSPDAPARSMARAISRLPGEETTFPLEPSPPSASRASPSPRAEARKERSSAAYAAPSTEIRSTPSAFRSSGDDAEHAVSAARAPAVAILATRCVFMFPPWTGRQTGRWIARWTGGAGSCHAGIWQDSACLLQSTSLTAAERCPQGHGLPSFWSRLPTLSHFSQRFEQRSLAAGTGVLSGDNEGAVNGTAFRQR
ncbi:hypothetical protein D9M72_327530 [compost metagenome]